MKPIRFKNSQDLNTFIDTLQQQKKITLETNLINDISEGNLAKQFLQASDGNIYLLDDVVNYLNDTNEEEINASTLSFFINTNQSISLPYFESNPIQLLKKQPVTLAEIKRNPELVKQLLVASGLSEFFEFLNPNLFSDLRLPPLKSSEDIEKARELYSEHKLVQKVSDKYNQILNSVQPSPTLFQIPAPLQSSDFLTYIHKDIYHIIQIQEIKLTSQLVNVLTHIENPQEKEKLEQWITTLSENSSHYKKFLELIIDQLKNHAKTTKESQLKYAQMMKDDPDSTKLNAALSAKNEEGKTLLASNERLANLFNVLKPAAAYGTLIGVSLLYLTAACVLAMFIGATLAATPLLLGFALLTLTAVVTIPAVLLMDPLNTLKEIIEDKFDSILEEKNKQHQDVVKDAMALSSDMLFRNLFSQLDPDFISKEVDHSALIQAIDSDLLTISYFELAARIKLELSSTVTVSSRGLFSPKNNQQDISSPVDSSEKIASVARP